jgi:CheY-like chemotaxis protein/HPt (histidine-containing phosphotransfer) domain-containing protein
MNTDHSISKYQKSESGSNVRSKSILIVDDNEINQKLLRVYLLSMGFQVFVAKDGYSALTVLEKQPIDLVFLDLHMPVMNGYETTKAIRQLDEKYGRIPIIGLSADGLPNSQHKALQSGMNEYLIKPIKQDDLRQILNKWLGMKEYPDSAAFSAIVASKADDLRLLLMKEMPDYKSRLVAALEKHDHAEVYQIAHRITGGSAYCELPELHRIANLLQGAAKRSNEEQIALYGSGLLEHIDHLLRDLPAVGNG